MRLLGIVRWQSKRMGMANGVSFRFPSAQCFSNWLVFSVDMRYSSEVARKNICVALALFEIPTSPDLTSIYPFKCSHAWSTPTVVNETSFLTVAILFFKMVDILDFNPSFSSTTKIVGISCVITFVYCFVCEILSKSHISQRVSRLALGLKFV